MPLHFLLNGFSKINVLVIEMRITAPTNEYISDYVSSELQGLREWWIWGKGDSSNEFQRNERKSLRMS